MADARRILVVGGGIAGLSLAVALRRAGAAPEVVERSPAWPAVGAGIVLHGNAVRALRILGVGEAIDAASAPLPCWGFFDQQGSRLSETDLADLWRDVGPCLAITRIRLQEILLAAAAGVPCRLGVALAGLVQHGPQVSVTFADGSAGEYDLVVGADGINSTVRRLAISPVPPQYAGTMIWRSVIPVRPPGADHMMLFTGERSFAGLVPVEDGSTYGFAGLAGDRFDDPPAGRLERLRQRFGGFGGPVPAYLAALQRDDQIHFGPVEWVELSCWHSGRAVLIGDAAHAAPPHMAEGGAMAIEDALVLAQLLDGTDTIEDSLGRYQARRWPRVQWVQQQSRLTARSAMRPLTTRDAALREHGDQILRHRYLPLIPTP
jgi:2-polyprenyl-6-methoxyphenol hydroxylase-like FAD-dependent oxidoreductase